MRIFSSAEWCRRVALRISRTVFSALSAMRLLACLIVAPQQGCDEPGILSYAIRPFCPTSADGLQAKLAGGVAVIRVGGATEVEVKERKDRVDDAMHATRAAVEEGILPGGGVALLRAVESLKRVKTANEDQKHGVEIVKKAITWPARQIAINAGDDGSVIVGKILEKDQYAFGFDAQDGEYADLVKKGIIDPTKVVRIALQDGASIAGLLITTEAMVAEKPKKETPMPAMPPGGGMDY
jgi:chaperonin GroEL